MRVRVIPSALAVLFGVSLADAQGATLRTRWEIQVNGSNVPIGSGAGDVAMSAGMWKCKYITANAATNHQITRGVVCFDGIGTAMITAGCQDNAPGKDTGFMALSKPGDSATTNVSIGCVTERAP